MQKRLDIAMGKADQCILLTPKLGILGANGIVAGGLPIAVGSAYSAKCIRKTTQVTVAFFGDGATNEGAFHEAMNMAATWNLPVLFVCENNQFGVSTRINRVTRETDLAKRSLGYGIPSLTIDGNDVLQVFETATRLIDQLRKGNGPAFLVCNTWRHHGHFEGEGVTYWEKEELLYWKQKDPIALLKSYLKASRTISTEEIEHVEADVNKELSDAIEFAKNSPYPDPSQALIGLYEKENYV